jgi:hypothetical protein
MFTRGFSDELVKLADGGRESPSIGRGLLAGGALGGAGGIAGLVSDPRTKTFAGLRMHSGELGKVLPFLKKINPALAEAAEELIKSPAVRRAHLAVPALTGAAIGGGAQLIRKLHHKKTASIKEWLNTPGGAMFAAHVPLGGAGLGALRAAKGHRLKNALKGLGGEIGGNIAGATAGLLASKIINHVIFHGAGPSWLDPAAIAGGGLIAAPAFMHALTKGK